jgi:hypothetical protein
VIRNAIIDAACRTWAITTIIGPRDRVRDEARKAVAYLMRASGASFEEIAQCLAIKGNKTAGIAVRSAQEMLIRQPRPKFAARLERLMAEFGLAPLLYKPRKDSPARPPDEIAPDKPKPKAKVMAPPPEARPAEVERILARDAEMTKLRRAGWTRAGLARRYEMSERDVAAVLKEPLQPV